MNNNASLLISISISYLLPVACYSQRMDLGERHREAQRLGLAEYKAKAYFLCVSQFSTDKTLK